MGKWVKWILFLFGGLLVLLVLAVLLVPALVDIETYRPTIEQKASRALGLDVHLAGDMELSLFPWVGVSVSDLSVDNPPEFTREKLLTVQSFDMRVKLLPLLSKDIQVKRFVLQQPRIILEKNASGKGNWEAIGGPPPKDTPPKKEAPSAPEPDASAPALPVNALAIDDFSVTGGSLLWADAAGGLEKEITEVDLRITDVSLEAPVPIAFSAVVDGKPVSMEGKIGPVGKQPGKGAIPFDIAVGGLGEITARLKGRIQDPTTAPVADLDIRIEPFSPRKVMSALNRPFSADTPGPRALETIAFAGHLSASPEKVSVSEGVLTLDETRMDISLTAADFAEPDLAFDITFDITIDRLDVTRYLPPEAAEPTASQTPEPAPSEKGSPAEVDLEPLRKITVDGAVRIGTLVVPEAKLSDLELALTGKEGTYEIRFQSRKDGQPIRLTATVGPIRTKAVPVDLALSALDTLNLDLQGKVQNPTTRPGIDMALRVAPFSPRTLFSDLNRPFPVETTDPEALSRIGFQGKIAADPSSLSVSDGILELDRSTLTFSASVKNQKAPDIRFDTRLDAIDLDRYLPPPSDSPADAESPKEESPGDPSGVDLEPLRKLRVNGDARIGKLKAAGAEIQDMRLKIFGENGIFRLDPLTLNLYRGNIAAKGRADLRPEIPASEMDLKVEGVQVGPLLRDVMNQDLMEGATQAELSLNMEGMDPDRIKRTLNGQGLFVFKDGSIKGVDLTAMVRNVDTAFTLLGLKEGGSTPSSEPGTSQTRTDFSELTLGFEIADGLVKIPEAALISPFIRATVSGRADLVQEALDLRVTPKFVATAKGQGDTEKRTGYMVPVVVGGTFSSPTFRPDVKAMIQMAPKETVTEILKDPKKGLDNLVKQKKEEFKDFLNLNPEKKETAPADPSRETEQPKQKEKPKSTQERVGDILKKLPFGN
ncbi:MAG: AsmA family protein [Thermodesulfobacteriota bacterium]